MEEKSQSRVHGNLAAFLLSAFFCAQPQSSEAQESIFDYLKQALVRVVTQSTIMNLAEYDYVAGNCLFGAYLERGEAKNLTMTFREGVEYVVMGAGDNDILDLDLKLLSPSGEILVEDTDRDPTPILNFIPDFSGRMTLQVLNYNSNREGFCVFVILQKSYSGNFSMRLILEALGNVITRSQIASLFASQFATNTFCLFGGQLDQGEATELYNATLRPGRYSLVGAGSDNISDVDLFIIAQQGRDLADGFTVCQDTESDNIPICTFSAYRGQRYLFRLKNHASEYATRGFVFAILLEL